MTAASELDASAHAPSKACGSSRVRCQATEDAGDDASRINEFGVVIHGAPRHVQQAGFEFVRRTA
jgi:hypothetical protein